MELTTEDIVASVREWSMERMDNTNHENARAIYEEFAEWIDIEGTEELDIMSIEPKD